MMMTGILWVIKFDRNAIGSYGGGDGSGDRNDDGDGNDDGSDCDNDNIDKHL